MLEKWFNTLQIPLSPSLQKGIKTKNRSQTNLHYKIAVIILCWINPGLGASAQQCTAGSFRWHSRRCGPSDCGAEVMAFHFLWKITKIVFVLCEEVPPVLTGKTPDAKVTTWVWTPMVEGKNQLLSVVLCCACMLPPSTHTQSK